MSSERSRIKKASEPIRRVVPAPGEGPPLTAEATKRLEEACLAEAMTLRERVLRAANFKTRVDHERIRACLHEWSKRMKLPMHEKKVDWRIRRGMGKIPISPSITFRPCIDSESEAEAKLFYDVGRKSDAMMGALAPISTNLPFFFVTPALVSVFACVSRLAQSRDFYTGHLRVMPTLAAIAVGATALPNKKLADLHMPLLEAFEAGCFLMWQSSSGLVYMERPYVCKQDPQGRLHCDNGPSLVWGDAIAYHYWHGSHVDAYTITTPRELITASKVDQEWNAENRRVLLERMGEDRYIVESGMQPVDYHDKFGTLFVKTFASGRPIARLRVINRSPEPDGTYKTYWLPINPELYRGDAGRYAHAAAASTWRTKPGGSDLFFRDWKDYDPRIET